MVPNIEYFDLPKPLVVALSISFPSRTYTLVASDHLKYNIVSILVYTATINICTSSNCMKLFTLFVFELPQNFTITYICLDCQLVEAFV